MSMTMSLASSGRTAMTRMAAIGPVGSRASMRGQLGRICLTGLLSLGALLLAPGSGKAELRRVEAVGIYGVREAARTKVIVRDRAVENALWEGVSRVALELVGDQTKALTEDDPGDGAGPREEPWQPTSGQHHDGEPHGSAGIDLQALRAALGKEVMPYTRGFRILEDQGEQPVLFDEDPATKTEYVVVVEVFVDVERVEAALQNAGWIAAGGDSSAEEKGRLELELLGLERYEALEALMAALGEELRADRVQLLELSPARQLLAVEGRFDARELETWLRRFRHPQLLVDSVGDAGQGPRLRVHARWLPLAEDLPSPAERSGVTPEEARRREELRESSLN